MNAYINQLDNILFVKKIQNPVGPSSKALTLTDSEKLAICLRDPLEFDHSISSFPV